MSLRSEMRREARKSGSQETSLQEKIRSDVAKFAKDLQNEIDANNLELPKTEKKKIEKKIVAKEEIQEKSTDIKPPKKLDRPMSLNGHSIVANDFRAICKKNNLNFSHVLEKIIHQWNLENYNL